MSHQPFYNAESQNSSGGGGFFKLFSLLALMLTLLLLLPESSISAKVAMPASPDGSFVSHAASAAAPGGVTENVAIWYTGESASPVATWSDLSGNGNDATQATASQQPTVVSNVLNGQPVVRFDGGDRLETAAISALDLRTSMIIVGKHSNPSSGGDVFVRSAYATNAHLTGIFAENGTLNAHARTSTGSFRAASTPGDTNYNIYGLRWDSGSAVELFLNGSLVNTATGATANPSGHISTVFGDNYSVAGYNLDGDIAEAIIFAGEPNDAQLNIIFNYLSAKYDLALSANDFYAGDTAANGDYDFDVAGIGMQTTAEASGGSAGLIISQGNGSLDNGEYVLAGHKTTSNAWTTDDLPAGMTQRWSRVWYLDKTGTVDATLGFDFSDAGIGDTPSGEYKLLYSATNAFSFSDTGVAATISGDEVSFTLADGALLDGYYTLAEVSSSPVGGGTGAGGVGSTAGNSSLALWLKANAGVTISGNGTTVTNWADQSGFGNDAGQFSTSFQPLFASAAINGQPALTFDGSDDYLEIADDNTLDFDTEQDFIFFAVINSTDANTGGILSKDVGSNQKSWWSRLSSGKFQVLLADGNGHEPNTASAATVTGVPHIISMVRDRSAGLLQTFVDGSQSSSTTDTTNQSLTNSHSVRIGRFNAGTHALLGDVSEIVLYNAGLNSAEHALVDNYLAAKYNITIGNDKYAGDTSAKGDYDLDVAGIGQEADGDNTTASHAGLTISEANDSLANGDYLLAGHKTTSNAWTTSDLPAGTLQRFERVWYLDKTGAVDAMLTFDFSDAGIGGTPNGEYKLLYSATNAFSFSDTGATATISDDQVTVTLPNESLLDGYYTLAEANTTGAPGGVTNNLTVWLKADAGTSTIVNGGAIASWADQSGNSNDATQATANRQPKYVSNLLNGYPGLHFYDGTHNHLKTGAIPALDTRPTVFLVGKHDNQGANIFIRSNYSSGAGWGSSIISGIFGENGSDYGHARTSTGSFRASSTSADSNFHLFNLEWNSSDQVILYRDGVSAGATAGANATPSGHVQTVIGSNSSNLASSLNGDITEVVIFAGTPSASEREQISSYLALKYGLTLPYNYRASSGATVYDVTGYGNNIAGIGQDDGSQWAQTSSQSSASDAIVRILHNDSFAADQTFLVWGHNGAASTIATNAGVPSGVAQWLERRWKVQETNSVGSVTVRVPTNKLAALTAGGDYVLIVADDANFTSNVQIVPMTTYGLDKQATFDFSGTQYFTFGRSAASPTITNVQPPSAISQFAVQIYIDGTAFQDGATVQLNTTALDTTYISPTRLNAWVPAGQADGTYNLTVTNPDESTGNLAAAFTVQSPAQGDLLTNDNKLLSTPLAPKAGDSTDLALVVNQQGGASTLSNVAVDFYQGDPNAGGTFLGRGTIASLAPDSSATTTAVNITAPAAGTYTFVAVIDPDGTVTEASESNNTVSRVLTILPSAVDSTKPTITKFTLDNNAQDTQDRKIRISLTGNDDEGVKRYRISELAYVPSTRNWAVVQESEWRNYTGRDFDWTLTPEGGGRYIRAYLSDAAGNVSTVSQQIITHLPTAEQIPTGALRYYLYDLAVGDNLEATVTPIQGNPDLFMYNTSQQVVARSIELALFVDQADYTAVDADYHVTIVNGRSAAYFNASFFLTEGTGTQAVMPRAPLYDLDAPLPTFPATISEAIPAPLIGDLSVEMDTMTTTATLDGITFNWTTTSETDNVGFNVYRSTSADDIGEQINGALINSRASDGAAYSVVDSAVELYETYYYTLESINTDGQSTFYNPVSGALVATHSNVTIVAGSTDTNIDRSEDGSNVTYAPTADSASVGADNIAADLEGGFNVLISTVSTGTGTQDGDISMNAGTGITWTTGMTLTMTANRGIVLNSGSSLNATGDGSMTLNGNPSGTTTGDFTGIELVNSPIQSGSGNMTLNGTGGDTGGFGVYLRQNGSQLTTSGDIQVTGDGPANQGIRLVDGMLIEATGSGTVTISGSSAANNGIHYDTNSQADGGIKSDSGAIQITGNSSAANGMELGEGASVSSVTGDVTVDGDSTGTGDGLLCPCFVSTGGNLLIQGDSANADGIEIRAGAQITTTGTGTLTLEGTGTATGILFTSDNSNLVQSSTGALTLITDNLALGNGTVASTGGGTLTIQPATASASIGIGGGAGTLNIDDAELGRLTDGFSSITIGNVVTGTGDVDIDSATFLDPVTLSGGTINDNAGTDITAPSVTLDGNVAPGQSLGQLVVSGDLSFTSGESLTLELNGTTPATEYDQVVVTGTVTLNDAVLTGTLGFTPAAGNEFIIINNDGADAVTGTFDGLAEGDTLTIGGTAFTISYVGGDGNDVVLFTSSAPVANDDLGSTDEDNVLNVAASGVLANDTDANGDMLTVSEADSSSANGATVTVNSDGSYSYDPTAVASLQALAAGESLTDTFSYTVSDGTLTDTAVVSITVSGVNDAPVLSNVSLTSSISENDTGTLSGQLSDVDTSDSFTLTVEWGDGSTESYNYPAGTSTFSETHQYLDDNPTGTATDNYTVTLTLADPNGGNDSDNASITVNNVAPNLDAGPDQAVIEGEVVTFSGSFTDTGTLDTHSIAWDFGDGETMTGTLSPTHTYNLDGVYTVTLTITDDDGGVGEDTMNVYVGEFGPIAADDDYTTDEDTLLTVPAPGVLDNDLDIDGDPLTAILQSGPSEGTLMLNPDGSFVYTPTLNFNGEATFTYVANDGNQDSNSATVTITVLSVNDEPIVDAGDDQTSDEGEEVQFEGSFTDPGLRLASGVSIEWDFGDGTTVMDTLTPTHIYQDDGTFTVTLTVTDSQGASSSDALLVTVNNVAPMVEVSGQMTATAGIAIDFTGTFTDPSPLDTHSYVWDFGDGETATDTLMPTHTYQEAGTVTVTLTVTDDDGAVGSDSLIVTVSGTTTAVTLTTLSTNSNWGPSLLLLSLFVVGMAWPLTDLFTQVYFQPRIK